RRRDRHVAAGISVARIYSMRATRRSNAGEAERPKPPSEPSPGTLGTPSPDEDRKSAAPADRGARRPLRPMKREGQRWRTNTKQSAKVSGRPGMPPRAA